MPESRLGLCFSLLEMPLLVCAPVAIVGTNISFDTTGAGGDLETKQVLQECRTYFHIILCRNSLHQFFRFT